MVYVTLREVTMDANATAHGRGHESVTDLLTGACAAEIQRVERTPWILAAR